MQLSPRWLRSFRKSEDGGRIHLDYASTTPVAPEVFDAMRPYWSERWANPSAVYKEGVIAREAIEEARTELARMLHVRADGVTFTSGGTESNNLAIVGTVEALERRGVSLDDMEVITSRIEHPSILESLSHLERKGVRIVYVPVTEDGLEEASALVPLLNSRTRLVTLAYVNSEIGTVNDVKSITRAVRKWNNEHGGRIAVHLDASQAPLWLPCELDMLGIDMMTLDAGKCYGPKGVGVLVRRHGVELSPILHGGGQERGLRSGTENTALIIGCVRALIRAQTGYLERSERASAVRDHGIEVLKKIIPGMVLNGSSTSRVANNINFSLPGLDSEYAVIWLDVRGIACSTKSACGVKGKLGSSVVREMTKDEARALSTLRLTFGEETPKAHLESFASALTEHIAMMDAGIGNKKESNNSLTN